jgi:hypothetical protein
MQRYELKRIAKECAEANPENKDVFIRLSETLARELLTWVEQWPQ